MARPTLFKNSKVISTRMEADFYTILQEIAALETINTGRVVTCQELIRNALMFVYGDNERLRECFRRSREHITKRV
jgi:hypothetical protein